MTAPTPRVLVLLATYNERDNLEPLLREIQAVLPAAEVLIIDDHSPDGTGELAEQLAAADPRVHVQHRPGKLGLGTALHAGLHYALAQGYDLLVTMDADFSHHPRYLPALLAGMADHEVMIGSRYVAGGGTRNWPWWRWLLSRSVNLLSRLWLRLPVSDASSGFRCYRLARMRAVDCQHLLSRGYSFQQEILYRCHRAGCKLGETPILFEDRRAGHTKVNWKEMVRSLAVLLLLGLRR